MRRPTILVVDDDRAIQELLNELLREAGYEVRSACSLAAAREVIRQQRPDVLILDVRLPDGNGLDLCAQLQHDPATLDLPVLVLSSLAHGSDFVAQGLDRGGYDVLAKPFVNEELLARVHTLVRLRRLQQQLLAQERVRAMLATAGAAAHRLGQPLTAALGLADLLLTSELTPAQRQDVELLVRALRHMGEIVRELQQLEQFITQPYLADDARIHILDLERASGMPPTG